MPWVPGSPQTETAIPEVIPLVEIPDAAVSHAEVAPVASIPDAETMMASCVDADPVASIPDAKTAEVVVLTLTRVESSAQPSSEREAVALAALVRQVENQVRIGGIQKLPLMNTVEEARAVLQRLMRPVTAVSAAW